MDATLDDYELHHKQQSDVVQQLSEFKASSERRQLLVLSEVEDLKEKLMESLTVLEERTTHFNGAASSTWGWLQFRVGKERETEMGAGGMRGGESALFICVRHPPHFWGFGPHLAFLRRRHAPRPATRP